MAGTSIKGITIELNGDTTGLDKALKGVNKEIKTTQDDLKQVDKLLKLDPGNMELLRQKQKLLNQAVAETSDKLSTLKEAAKQANEQLQKGEITQAQYDALQREIIATEQSLKSLEEQASKSNAVLAKIGDTADKVSRGAQKVADSTKALSASAAGALGSLAAAGYGAITASDDLNTLSKQSGFTTAELQKMGYAADRIDVSTEDITGAAQKLKTNMATVAKAYTDDAAKMEKAMMAAAKKAGEAAQKQHKPLVKIEAEAEAAAQAVKDTWEGTSNATALAMEQLGISVTDVNGQMRDSTAVFWDVVKALSTVENETERDQLAMTLLGKSADSLAGIIDDGGAAFRELGDEAEKAGLIMSQETLDSLNAVNDEIDKVKATAKATLAETGAKAVQAALPVIEEIIGYIGRLLEYIGNLDENQIKMIVTVLAVVAAISPVASVIGKVAGAISTLTPLLSVAVTWISSAASAIGSFLLPMLSAAGSALSALWGIMLANPITIVIAIVAAIIAIIVHLWNTSDEFRAYWTMCWEAIKEDAKKAADAISGFLSNLWSFILNLWTSLQDGWNAFTDFVSDKWNALKDKLHEGAEAIYEAIKNAYEKSKEAGKAALEGLLDISKSIANGLISVVEGAVNHVIGSMNSIINAANSVISTIASFAGFSFGGIPQFSYVNLPRLAKGGTFRSGSAIVGEVGPEILTVAGGAATVTPLTGGNSPRGIPETLSGSSFRTEVNIEFTGALSQLGAVLQPVITAETTRLGKSLIGR